MSVQNVVVFRSWGQPFGAEVCAIQLDVTLTHEVLQERLKSKSTDGAWLWTGVPSEPEIVEALEAGRPIGSVPGASLLVLHPDHDERWNKCEATVYWGAVEALYAAEPDAPPLDELLHLLDRIRKPMDDTLLDYIRTDIKRRGVDFATDPSMHGPLREMVERFIRVGALPEQLTQTMIGAAASPEHARLMHAGIYAARLASPRDRRAAVAALPLVGLPDLLG